MIEIYCDNKYFTTYEFSTYLNISNENLKRFITRNKSLDTLNYKGKIFTVKEIIKVRTILNQYWKDMQKFKGNFKLYACPFKLWDKLVLDNPTNNEYKEFKEFLYQQKELHKNKFNFLKVCKKWYRRKETWICDTETTFTHLVPNEILFYDVSKAFGNNPLETLKNLNIEGIREFFKNNPTIKPYMWAFHAKNKKTKERILLNYQDAVKYLDKLNNNVLYYFHNLSYDAHYIFNPLIDEKGYVFFTDNKNDNKIIQPNKTIKIFAQDNKIFKMDIKNSIGKKISFECTYLKTMSSVDKLGEVLKKPKLELNYLTPRKKDHIFTDNEKEYIFRDVDIVDEFMEQIEIKYLKRFNKPLKWGLTIGMTCMQLLKDFVGKDLFKEMFVGTGNKKDETWEPIINARESEILRSGYNGGYTNYNIRYVGLIHTNIVSEDIKSAYPDKWQNYKMPYKSAIYNCKCDNDLTNNSEHFKIYKVKIKNNIMIQKYKENLIPLKMEITLDNGKYITNSEYYPFINKKEIYWSQYMLKIFLILFKPNKNDYEITKEMCFKHKIIKGFKEYIDFWQEEKETPGLKNENEPYYDLCKLNINTPTGKMGQKEIIDETVFSIDENNNVTHKQVKIKNFEDLDKFSYLPIIIATTDMTRLQLLSMIEEIGWNNWHNSDTDSCKFWLPEKYKPKYNPTYLNLINDTRETIYNEPGKNLFGKWDLEWTTPTFKCCGKKKYIYDKWNKDKWVKIVKCAGATKSITNDMNFENFFVGYHSLGNDKNMISRLNGMPTILPTTFNIKNVFRSKHMIMMGYKDWLHPYYIKHLKRIAKDVIDNYDKVDKDYIDFGFNEDDNLNLLKGTYI